MAIWNQLAVHHPAVGRMRRQAGIVVGFFDEVLGRRALVVEPHQGIQRSSMSVTKTRYVYSGVSKSWYCSGCSASLDSAGFS